MCWNVLLCCRGGGKEDLSAVTADKSGSEEGGMLGGMYDQTSLPFSFDSEKHASVVSICHSEVCQEH